MAINKPTIASTDIWADSALAGDKVKPAQAKIDSGWVFGEKPPHSDFNWHQNQLSQLAIHNNERGVNEWDSTTEYQIGAYAWESGVIYQNISGAASTGDQPSLSASIWLEQNQAKAIVAGQRKNLLMNVNFSINQRAFAGGQPASGVYGYDRWKGDALGTRIEQVVENTKTINETYTISWDGGTGTADVDAITGLNSGDSFTLNVTGNFSVIVPTDATNIQLEKGSIATDLEYRPIAEELALCQRYCQRLSSAVVAIGSRSSVNISHIEFPLATPLRTSPIVTGLDSATLALRDGTGYDNSPTFNSVLNYGFANGSVGLLFNTTLVPDLNTAHALVVVAGAVPVIFDAEL